MIITVTCNTDRFNLSVVGKDFINDCCFGEDFSKWLVEELGKTGVEADVICMEDFGWANSAKYQDATYLMCVAGVPANNPSRPNYGEWHVMLERKRSLMEKLFGKNRIAATEPIFEKIQQMLRSAGLEDVAIGSNLD